MQRDSKYPASLLFRPLRAALAEFDCHLPSCVTIPTRNRFREGAYRIRHRQSGSRPILPNDNSEVMPLVQANNIQRSIHPQVGVEEVLRQILFFSGSSVVLW